MTPGKIRWRFVQPEKNEKLKEAGLRVATANIEGTVYYKSVRGRDEPATEATNIDELANVSRVS